MKKRAVEQERNLILYLNRDQLAQGKKSDGTKITPPYKSVRYAMKKYQMNNRAGFGTPDLYLSGRFQNSFKIKFRNNQFTIRGKTPYSDKLEKKYGHSIYGLTAANFRQAQKAVTRQYVHLWKTAVKQ